MVNVHDLSTEQRIIRAARKVFIAKGMAGARMQDIANEAGINKALLHYYFRSKDKLFEMVFKEAIDNLLPKVASIISDPGTSLFYKIERFCEEYITIMTENPFIPLFVINEVHQQPEEFLSKMWGDKKPPVHLLIEQIDADVKNHRIRHVTPHQLLMNILSLCIFPFLGRPMWQFVTEMNDEEFKKMIEQRKADVPRFVIRSIMM